MKKLFLLVSMLCISLSAFAYNDANRIYLGIEGGTYSYREPHMDGPIHISGNKIGATFEWVGKSILAQSGLVEEDDNSFATFDFRYITGKTDYDGWLQDSYGHIVSSHSASGEQDYYWEARLTFGASYDLGGQFELWPYLGLGYRYLVNDGTNVDPEYSYRRISKYVYMPIGVKLSKTFQSGVILTLSGEFDWLLAGEQESDLTKLTGDDRWYMYNQQKEGWGLRFGLKAEVPVTQKIGVFVEPYYRMWKIQNSDLGESATYPGYYYYELGGIEPFNITKEAGIRAGIYF